MTRLTVLLTSAALVWGLAATAQETATDTAEDTAAETTAESSAETEAPAVEKIDADAQTVLATVNGQDITLGHLIVIRAGLPPEYQGLSDEVLLNGILDQLIQQTAVAVEPEGGLPLRVQVALENEKRAILAAENLEAVAATAVTDELLQAAYDATYANVPAEQEFNASHILVDTEETANELVTMLEGGADFAELAVEKSTGPSGPNGGQLGWFGKGAMVPDFEAAVVELEVGAVSAPVQTQFGWHVVKLNEVREKPRPTLDDVREELSAGIREDVVRSHVEAAAAAAVVTRIDINTIDASLLSQPELLDQ